MILVDSSIWIEHFRFPSKELANLIAARLVYGHPAVIGELACGNLSPRGQTLQLLKNLHPAPVARDEDLLDYIEANKLMGKGVGYIDVQLLASVAIMDGRLWTRDHRLKRVAETLGLSY